MLRNVNDFLECSLDATDGRMGKLCDAYFDDEVWVIRYFVVDMECIGETRRVLMPARVIGSAPHWGEHLLPVGLSKHQISISPESDTQQPMSRQHARGCLDYYTGLGHADFRAEYQRLRSLDVRDATASGSESPDEDAHLRRVNEVVSYDLHATDGDIGKISGFLIDERSWAIRFMIVRTSHWWTGHHVLIAPESIDEVCWGDGSVIVALTRQAVRTSPAFDESTKFYDLQGERSRQHQGLSADGPAPH